MSKLKPLDDLYTEAYNNHVNSKKQINALIEKLSSFVTSQDTSIMLGPILSTFINSSLKNDDNLIKLINTIKKSENPVDEMSLSQDELDDLLSSYKEEHSKMKKAG